MRRSWRGWLVLAGDGTVKVTPCVLFPPTCQDPVYSVPHMTVVHVARPISLQQHSVIWGIVGVYVGVVLIVAVVMAALFAWADLPRGAHE